MRAGHLYASNDYQHATELARELILDEGKRKAMAAAGRAHVEKLGWMAAVKRIRDTQYQRAINTFRAHKRSVPVEISCQRLFNCLHPANTQTRPTLHPCNAFAVSVVGLCAVKTATVAEPDVTQRQNGEAWDMGKCWTLAGQMAGIQ